jgi:ParB-like chromosome segregation protein Spo0J
LREPVILFEGKILDGRHRYEACRDAKVECDFKPYAGHDPLGFAISLNLRRRHLTSSQRAMLAGKLANLKQGQKKANTAVAVSQQEAAKRLQVSIDSVQRAQKVHALGTAELIQAVETGEITVSKAALIADLSKRDQQKSLSGENDQWQTADIFAGLRLNGSAAANAQFEEIIDAAISTIQKLNKIVADATWALRGFDKRKLKSGRTKYIREIKKLPRDLRDLLADAQTTVGKSRRPGQKCRRKNRRQSLNGQHRRRQDSAAADWTIRSERN